MIALLSRAFYRHVVYPAVVRLRGEQGVFPALRELETLQWRSPEELVIDQRPKLAAILAHAAASVPFYRDHWKSDTPALAGQNAAELLGTLSCLTKADLQHHASSLMAQGHTGPVTRKTTGGSTGQAVTIWKDRRGTAREMAVSWLAYGWYGVRIGDRAVRFWGQPFNWKRRLRFAAADFATHRLHFSAFGVNDAHLLNYWRRCTRFRPDYFYGYVSMLEAFAAFVQNQGLDGVSLGLKSIITTSEVLSEPQRKRLAATFGCPVQNEYGCGEVGPIAYECPEGSLHLMTDHLWIELLDERGAPVPVGETGEVVVTDLYNQAMPLIRYRLGDFAVRGRPCRCGRGFPTIERVWGRAYDFVEGPDGKKYHGEFFMYVFEEMRDRGIGASQFQVIQDSPRTITFSLVSPTEPTDAQIAHLERQVHERLGRVQVSVRRVDRIERSASGKLPLIVNRSTPRATAT